MAKVMVIDPGTGDEQTVALGFMLRELVSGRRVIVGTYKDLREGEWVAGHVDGRSLVVKRRATREEFLANVPPTAEPGDPGFAAPFYFELEEAAGPELR